MSREPDLEVVNRALTVHVQKLTEELKEADREIRRLRAELADAHRVADVERGRG